MTEIFSPQMISSLIFFRSEIISGFFAGISGSSAAAAGTIEKDSITFMAYLKKDFLNRQEIHSAPKAGAVKHIKRNRTQK